ncbi:hypothetical protein F9K91_16150 [Brucella tritici]|uniref:Integral membrane protein n=1 Tax=Brucella tritici TaxID=94626 RepID=A0A6L3YTT6_9HYPH|nr:hypothetical protein [Brucella tritici]KAB2663955.1 hypothetical protein F9K91_16150 [Brucella tritici]KAB2687122.1 hypothetical protein F9L08_09100 [Brucella tritici]
MKTAQTVFALKPLVAIDAITCAAMGAALVVASATVGELTGIPASLLYWAGVLLLPVAAFMAWVSRSANPPAWAVNLVILGNGAWVAASLFLPVAGMITPNLFGWVFLVGQAAAVTVLTGLEVRASRTLQAAF